MTYCHVFIICEWCPGRWKWRCLCVCVNERSWLSERCTHPSEVWISLSTITLQAKSTKFSEGTGWGKASAEIWRRMKEKARNRHTKLRWRPTWPTMWPQWDGKKKRVSILAWKMLDSYCFRNANMHWGFTDSPQTAHFGVRSVCVRSESSIT